MFPGAYSAAMVVGGTVSGMIVGDVLNATATKNTGIPATGSSATPKTTADGTPVNARQTPRQSLFLSAAIVVGALVILLAGARVFRDARIG